MKRNVSSKNKIACILNYPAHYRENIFLKMEESLDCDFYFGNIEEGRIKKINYHLFKNPIKNLRTKRLYFNFNWITGMTSILFKKYDTYILTANPFILSNWWFLLLNLLQKKKIYFWGHGWYGREGRLKTVLKIIFFKLSNGVFLYGNYAKRLMESKGFNGDKLHVIYNSLDYELQLSVRKLQKPSSIFQNHFKNNYPTIIFTGRLTPVKRIDLLIKAHGILKRKGMGLNVVILGDGPERSKLENEVKSMGLEKKYWFYGECYDEEKIGELYYNSDVCVSPGNVGLTAIHSMSYGCPVITHNNFTSQMPEFEAIETNKTGFFFKENDAEDLSTCIFDFLNSPKNKENIRENCFKIIDEYYNPNYQIRLLNKVLKSDS